jgi:hypothetical protein
VLVALVAHADHQVDKDNHSADYVEFTFADQYLGRNEMWRLGKHLVGRCVFVDQEISFIGVIVAKVQTIYINGQKVVALLSLLAFHSVVLMVLFHRCLLDT